MTSGTGSDPDPPEVGLDVTSPFPDGLLNEPPPTIADAVDPVGAVAMIVVKRGPNAGSRFTLDASVCSAGRHPNSDIFLDDITASRRHVEFRRENDEIVIVDVGSLNGTYVNRMPVQSAVLVNGDEIRIGNFELVFLTGERRA